MGTAAPAHSKHYDFATIGDGVTFGRARPDGTGLCNTGIVDLGPSTLVFDTSLSVSSAREIREAARAITKRPPSLCANSHWHMDHTVGNQIFADRPIYASRRTIEILLERRAEFERELSPEKLEADIRELERQRDAQSTEFGRAQYEGVIRLNRAILPEAHEFRFTLPTHAFDQQLELPGDLDAKLLNFGAGHTESDTVLFLGKSRTLFAGDLVVSGTHPNLRSGDPQHWLVVLDQLEKLRPERVVTGHGPLGGLDSLETMRDYLSTVVGLAGATGTAELPERFRSFSEPGQFFENIAFLRGRSTNSK
jgi:cyclase